MLPRRARMISWVPAWSTSSSSVAATPSGAAAASVPIHVRAPSADLLLDCGASSVIAMKRFGVAPNDIDAILISHVHGDHFDGIPSSSSTRSSSAARKAAAHRRTAGHRGPCSGGAGGALQQLIEDGAEVRDTLRRVAGPRNGRDRRRGHDAVRVVHGSGAPPSPCASRSTAARSPTRATQSGPQR